jgi:hypothetical protein
MKVIAFALVALLLAALAAVLALDTQSHAPPASQSPTQQLPPASAIPVRSQGSGVGISNEPTADRRPENPHEEVQALLEEYGDVEPSPANAETVRASWDALRAERDSP